jgi:mono/diheme cytochrome c family protein
MTTVWTWRWTRVAVRAVITVAVGAAVALPVPAAGQTAPAEPEVTFTKDIAPIFQRSCQNCHRPNSLAPMSLLTYEDARPWARAIKARTSRVGKSDVMPPG